MARDPDAIHTRWRLDVSTAEPSGEPNREPSFTREAVAARFGIDPRRLQRYERFGLVEPRRDAGRARLYSEADVIRVQRIERLVEDLDLDLAAVEVVLHMRERIVHLQREIHLLRRRPTSE